MRMRAIFLCETQLAGSFPVGIYSSQTSMGRVSAPCRSDQRCSLDSSLLMVGTSVVELAVCGRQGFQQGLACDAPKKVGILYP